MDSPFAGGNWGRPILGGGGPAFDVTKSTLKATAPVFVPRQQFIPQPEPQMPVYQPEVCIVMHFAVFINTSAYKYEFGDFWGVCL